MRDNMRQVAFIGFGEAAYYIAKGLKESGVTDMAAYDVNYKKGASPVMERRAEEAGVLLTEDGKWLWRLPTRCSPISRRGRSMWI